AQSLVEPDVQPLPPFVAADHRRLDEDLLPAPRRARVAVATVVVRARLAGRRQREEIVLGRGEVGLAGGARVRELVRHLRERYVLRETPGGEPLGLAAEEGEQ